MEFLVALFTIGVSTYLAYYLLIVPMRNVNSLRGIPTPKGSLPILGNAVEMWKAQYEFDKLVKTHMEEYGNRLTMWATYWYPIVVLGSARDARKVLGSKEHVQKGYFYKAFDLPIGTGMFNAPVPIWKQKRPLLEKAFHSRVLSRCPEVFNKCGKKLIQILEEDGCTNGKTFDIHHYTNLCAMQMLVEGSMEVPINVMDERNSSYWKNCIESYNTASHMCEFQMLRPWYLFFEWLWSLTPSARKTQEAFKWSNENFYARILRKKREIRAEETQQKKSGICGDSEKMPCFLDLMLDLQQSNPELNITEQDILYEIASLYIAGHDASGKGIAFTLLFLGHHEEYQNKVVAELNEVLGDDLDTPLTEAHLKQMAYLECCIKESLRLMPPVPFMSRTAGCDIKLDDDVIIPKGTEVGVITFHIHRDPSIYPNPNEFQPDRFLPENSKGRDPYAWIPFSAGPRNCMGPKFAMMEEKVIIVNVLRKYRVVSVGSRGDWNINQNITLKLTEGWNVQLSPR